MDWKSNFEKNLIQKLIKKTAKVKLPHVNKKTTREKANFCSNTVFSIYFKIRAKKIHAAKPLAFSPHFLFRRDQNYDPNLTSKMMKMGEQMLKKRQRPNAFLILCHDVTNNSRYRFAAITKVIVNSKSCWY